MSNSDAGLGREIARAPLVDIREIWRHKAFVALFVALTLAMGAAYVRVTSPIYEVQRRLIVREDNPALEPPRNSLVDREFLATQAELIRSPIIVRRALERAPITVPPTYVKGDVAYVLESLSVAPVIQTDIIKVGFRSTSADQAKALTAALIDEYRQHVLMGDQGRHSEELVLLAKQETNLRQQLEELHDAYTQFRHGSPLVGQGRETLTVQADQLNHIGQRLSEARNHRIQLENTLQTYAVARASEEVQPEVARVIPVSQASLTSSPGPESAADAPAARESAATNVLRDASPAGADDLAEVQSQLWQARTRTKDLSQKFGPRHPDMIAAHDQVIYWEKLLGARVEAAAAGLQHELEAAKTTEANLQTIYEDERKNVKKLDDFLVTESAHLAKIGRVEELYATTVARQKEHQLTEEALQQGRSSVTIEALDGEQIQEELIWPQPKSFLALCGLLGLVSSVVIISLRTHRRAS